MKKIILLIVVLIGTGAILSFLSFDQDSRSDNMSSDQNDVVEFYNLYNIPDSEQAIFSGEKFNNTSSDKNLYLKTYAQSKDGGIFVSVFSRTLANNDLNGDLSANEIYAVLNDGRYVYWNLDEDGNEILETFDDNGVYHTLFTAEPDHSILAPSVSPDGSKLMFSELCGLDCTEIESERNLNMWLLDLRTNELTVVYQENQYGILWNAAPDWVSDSVVAFIPVCEVCEGMAFPSVKIFNLMSGVVSEVMLDPNAKQFDLSPSGDRIAYVVWQYSAESESWQSNLYVKNVLMQNIESAWSDNGTYAYLSVHWRNDNELVSQVSTVDYVETGLDSYPVGDSDLWLIPTKGADYKVLQIDRPVYSLADVFEDIVYYHSQSQNEETFDSLRALDLNSLDDIGILDGPHYIQLLGIIGS